MLDGYLSLLIFALLSYLILSVELCFGKLVCCYVLTLSRHAPLAWRVTSFGQLVRLGFDIAVFTPASYQRHRL